MEGENGVARGNVGPRFAVHTIQGRDRVCGENPYILAAASRARASSPLSHVHDPGRGWGAHTDA